MGNQKLISFDLQADFAFFKKPDYNDGLLLSYNMLHKPALLGILGAIIGLAGYQEKKKFPEYYQILSGISIGIEPLEGKHEQGNFSKTMVKYTNTVGYANQDGNLLIEECMLIRPGYRCYLLLSLDDVNQVKLYEYLKTGQAEYIPYLGKNEFQAWFSDSFIEYDFKDFHPVADFRVSSLFIKEGVIKDKCIKTKFRQSMGGVLNESSFSYFERLPVGFDPVLLQYQLAEFVYTDWLFKADSEISMLFSIKDNSNEKVIQLF